MLPAVKCPLRHFREKNRAEPRPCCALPEPALRVRRVSLLLGLRLSERLDPGFGDLERLGRTVRLAIDGRLIDDLDPAQGDQLFDQAGCAGDLEGQRPPVQPDDALHHLALLGRRWNPSSPERSTRGLITSYWDDLLRLATSVQLGTVPASLMLRRLGSYPRQNGLALALREVGRIERTLFTLDWLADPAPRRQATAELNKSESRNALARAVCF